MGPDGAIYIADWYNPIIQHGEVDFRDPRRDHTHGRIWRVTAKGRPLVARPQLVGAAIERSARSAQDRPRTGPGSRPSAVLKERGEEAHALPDGLGQGLDCRKRPRLRASPARRPVDLPGAGRGRAEVAVDRLLAANDARARAGRGGRVLAAWHAAVARTRWMLLAERGATITPACGSKRCVALARGSRGEAVGGDARARQADGPVPRPCALAGRSRVAKRLAAGGRTAADFDFGGNAAAAGLRLVGGRFG